jgi:hypothetical protein
MNVLSADEQTNLQDLLIVGVLKRPKTLHTKALHAFQHENTISYGPKTEITRPHDSNS